MARETETPSRRPVVLALLLALLAGFTSGCEEGAPEDPNQPEPAVAEELGAIERPEDFLRPWDRHTLANGITAYCAIPEDHVEVRSLVAEFADLAEIQQEFLRGAWLKLWHWALTGQYHHALDRTLLYPVWPDLFDYTTGVGEIKAELRQIPSRTGEEPEGGSAQCANRVISAYWSRTLGDATALEQTLFLFLFSALVDGPEQDLSAEERSDPARIQAVLDDRIARVEAMLDTLGIEPSWDEAWVFRSPEQQR